MAEAFAGDHRGEVARLDDFFFIRGMDATFLGREEARPHLDAAGTEHHRGGKAAAVCNAARRQNRSVVASQTRGTSTIVVSSPTCPPLSPPSAMRADAPRRVISFAMATEATTGMTLIPASFQSCMYFEGLPAPGRHDGDALLRSHLRNFIRERTHEHDVDTEGLFGQGFGDPDLLAYIARRRCPQPRRRGRRSTDCP